MRKTESCPNKYRSNRPKNQSAPIFRTRMSSNTAKPSQSCCRRRNAGISKSPSSTSSSPIDARCWYRHAFDPGADWPAMVVHQPAWDKALKGIWVGHWMAVDRVNFESARRFRFIRVVERQVIALFGQWRVRIIHLQTWILWKSKIYDKILLVSNCF